jgi:phosphate transport system protein
MERHFEQDLRHLEERFQDMGILVQRAIHGSIQALRTLDRGLAMEIVDHIEPEIDRLNREIDRLGFDLLALQQPLATDLRLVTAIMKNNSDLERMGDKAVNLALDRKSVV